MQPGDVLVAAMTSPPWTPLFGVAAAVVTDTGGILSHCAVVAREYLAGPGQLELLASEQGADYVVTGQIVDVTTTRKANPNYKPPTRAANDDSLGRDRKSVV